MAPMSGALTTKVTSGSPYQLSKEQVTRASNALLRAIKDADKQKAEQSTTKNLLADADEDGDSGSEEEGSGDVVPIWLVLTTKKHIVDKNRLKPGKIHVPHSLYASPSLSICIITADPQRAVKDVVSDPLFPKDLSSRINKVIGFTKLRERYKSFESRRQLLAEHDVFLADDRIILRLVQALGKTFFKSSKRPIPIRIEEIQKVNGKRVGKDARKRPPPDQPRYAAVASPAVVAREIERTLNAVPVHLAPAATSAVRVGLSTFSSDQLVENVEAVVAGMTDKYVSKGWRNIKAVHVKGPNTMALPIWLASELWLDDNDGQEHNASLEEGGQVKAIEGVSDQKAGKKRKSTGGGEQDRDAKSQKSKKSKATAGDDNGEDDDAGLIASRKQKLRDQKAKARSEVADDTVEVATDKPSATKLSKKKR